SMGGRASRRDRPLNRVARLPGPRPSNDRLVRDVDFQAVVEYRDGGIRDREHGRLPSIISNVLNELRITLNTGTTGGWERVGDQEQAPLSPRRGREDACPSVIVQI